MTNVAILGFGVVGSGTAELLVENRALIARKTGEDVCVKYIVDIRDFPESPFHDRIVHDFALVENDPEVSVVIEVIGGVRAAYDFTKRALAAGKSVVTSNKELVATHGIELLALAKEKGCQYLFEASVGGGIPVLHPLCCDLSHNELREVTGILNGTTNYILTRMVKGGVTMETALREAQANGYAEADPTADIEGHDACRKIAILAALAFGILVPTDRIHTEGITAIRAEDVAAVGSIGASVKLLGRAILRAGEELYLTVAPFVIGSDSPLCHVDDVYNAISVKGDFVGDVMFYGRGAGSLPTASAVVADVCTLLRGEAPRISFRPCSDEMPADFENFACGRYLAVEGVDQTAVKVVFGEVHPLASKEGEYAFLAEVMSEKELHDKCRRLTACGARILSSIRVF